MTRRVYVSSPRDEYLDERRIALKRALIDQIAALGYEPQVFGAADGGRGSAVTGAWSPERADSVMRGCVGAALLGFPIWRASMMKDRKRVSLVTEYCHYEGALARAYGLPILAVLEQGAAERVIFERHGDVAVRPPSNAEPEWVTQATFQDFLRNWQNKLRLRRDVFLAYSSGAEGSARNVTAILTRLGATVLDWQEFAAGPSILQQIGRAARLTTGGVFLFTGDDRMEGDDKQAAPRDNVIFEAGLFVQSKGHERILIIREPTAKMPADLGGVIYEVLPEDSQMSGLEERLKRFIETQL
jgi:hypothetical protein